MATQPTGTVTLLFTDIEGSTRLLQELGRDRYAEALELHRRLLRQAFDGHDGYEVDCEGDAFFVAFASAEDAVAAAAAAQRALAEAAWPGGFQFRVRMGLHTGEPLAASTCTRRRGSWRQHMVGRCSYPRRRGASSAGPWSTSGGIG
jgi:class 3 adenylate cyclase